MIGAIKALAPARQQNGFKRSHLAVKGVSDRQVQQALKSLASTGYLDSDGKPGPQGHTYTLVRAPGEMGTGIRLRPPGDGGGDDESEDDPGAREGDRAPESRRDAENEEVDPGAEDVPEAGDLRREETGDRSTGDDDPDEEGEDPLEELTQRGWFRVRELPGRAEGEAPAMDEQELERDPMADRILGEVTLPYFDSGWRRDAWVATDAELAEACREEDPARARERLIGMLPALQAKRRYYDPFVAWHAGQEDRSLSWDKLLREGFMHVERWEKEDEEDGLWVFLPLKPRWTVPERHIQEHVLHAVRFLEDPKVYDGLEDLDWDDDE